MYILSVSWNSLYCSIQTAKKTSDQISWTIYHKCAASSVEGGGAPLKGGGIPPIKTGTGKGVVPIQNRDRAESLLFWGYFKKWKQFREKVEKNSKKNKQIFRKNFKNMFGNFEKIKTKNLKKFWKNN